MGGSGKLGTSKQPNCRSSDQKLGFSGIVSPTTNPTMKNFLKVLLGFIVLLVIAGALLLSRVNTESNKQAIASAVLDASGYELTIGGDLSLDLFPTFGLSLADVRLKNPAYPQELGSASRVVLRVEVAPLINGSIEVQEIIADDFHVNYFIDAEGNAIWSTANSSTSTASAGASSTASSSPSGETPDLAINQLQIRNASIDVQDSSRGSRYRLDDINLISRNTNINGRSFPIELSFDYENNGMSAPIPMSVISDVSADVDGGNFELQDIRVSVTPMLMTGFIEVSSVNSSPTYNGELSADAFDLIGLLQSLGVMETESTPSFGIASGRELAFNLAFSGNSEQASLDSLNIDFANTRVEADANVRMASDFAPMNVSYNLNAGAIDLSPFFPTEEDSATDAVASIEEPTASEESTVNPAAQYQPETEIPAELVRDITVLGSTSIESIIVNDMRFDDINIFTNIEDGVLDVEMPPLSAFEGSVQATLRLNAQQSVPSLEIGATSANLNLVNLAPSLSRFNTVTGFLNTESLYTAQGVTTSDVMDSLSGNTAFSITENSVDIGVIKQVFTAIAALSPTGEAIQQWPDVIRFNEMSGYHLVANGFEADQEIRLRMDNFDVSGTGGFDLNAGTFDYDMGFTVLGDPYTQTIPINELYHNVTWPVDCSATFSEDVNRYCRPDFTRVREIFAQIGTNAVRGQLEEAITDQLPNELQDAARGLLRNIFN